MVVELHLVRFVTLKTAKEQEGDFFTIFFKRSQKSFVKKFGLKIFSTQSTCGCNILKEDYKKMNYYLLIFGCNILK